MGQSKKLRVLFLSHDTGMGGAESALLTLLSGLDREIFEPYVILPYEGRLIDEIEKLQIPYFIRTISHWIPYRLNFGWLHFWNFLKTLRARTWAISNLIERYSIDLVYSNTVTCIDGAIAAYLTKRPHIWHIHEHLRGNSDVKPYIPYILIPWIVSAFSKHIVVVSKSISDALNIRGIVRKTSIVHTGIDIERFSACQRHATVRDELEVDDQCKIIAIVGAINPLKGHLTFIKSARIVKERIKGVVFIIVGRGKTELEENLKQLVADYGLKESIYFLGWRADIDRIMRSIDLLVIASESEGLPTVAIEAMASGKPVVSTKCGGSEDLIVQGETGLLVPIGDHVSMATAIIKIITDNSISRHFATAGRKLTETFFSREAYIRNIQNIILAVSKTHGLI